jgi:anion-transporting  ArsA/GET3 family ATPase
MFEPRAIFPGLSVASLSVTACLADFATRKIHLGMLGRWIFESRAMTAFVESVPGLSDAVQLGKLENRLMMPLASEPPLDLIVLDGPATGHGLTLLSSARGLRAAARVGPFHDLAAEIEALLDDTQRAAIVAVTLPELLPVHETIELLAAQADAGRQPDLVVVNQHLPPLLPPGLPTDDALRALHATPELRRIADERIAQERRQAEAIEALRTGLARIGCAAPVVTLPRLSAPPRGVDALRPLAAPLESTP